MNEEFILSSASYNNHLMYESVYGDYLFDKIQQENVLNMTINKQLIMTESSTLNTKITKLNALYEAKLSDSIKAKWQKFIDFINSIASKFMESLTKILFSQKKYLERYKDIILNKKFKISLTQPLSGNYDEGVKRCNNVTIPILQYNPNTMETLKSDDMQDIVRLIINDFDYDGGKTLPEQFKDYFLGADRGTTKTLDGINRANMYNFCYNADKIESTQKKDIDHIKATTNTMQRAITDELSKEESYVIEAGEDKTQPTASTSGSGNNDTAKPGSVKLNTNPINSAVDDNDKVDEDEAKANGKQAEANGESKSDISKAFDKWREVCSAIITSKMTAQEAIAKDYMGIIRAHVRSYVGKKDNEEDTEDAKKATNYARNNENK